MSTIQAPVFAPVFTVPTTSEAPSVNQPIPPTPPPTDPLAARAAEYLWPSLRELRLREPHERVKRESSTQPASTPSSGVKVRGRFPAPDKAKKADDRVRKNLIYWLEIGKKKDDHLPKNASITPFVEMYNAAIKEPAVQAWFKATGLKPGTVRVNSESVSGTVVRDGKESYQRFTATDGSGWGQVGARVQTLQRILSPNDVGIPIATGTDAVDIPRNVQLDFYGSELPDSEKAAKLFGKHHPRWPSISQEQHDQWAGQFQQLRLDQDDKAVRSRLIEQLPSLIEGKSADDKLNLEEQTVEVPPGSSLDQACREPRDQFLEFLKSSPFERLLQRTAHSYPGEERKYDNFRIFKGDLQMLNGEGHWLSLGETFDIEIDKMKKSGNPADDADARKMEADFYQLKALSKHTGDTLYSWHTFDARQALAFYSLDAPETAKQLRGTLSWLDTQLPTPPLAGNYAGMTPYGQDPDALSDKARDTFKAASGQVMALFKNLSTVSSGFQSYHDPDSQLAAFFDSPDAIALAEKIAKDLKLFDVADGKALPRATRHQLLATTLKFSVDAPVPGVPGTVAGYELYQPANLGRTLKDVRADVEAHLKSKGVDPKVTALMAHLFLAQSAPEMLIKRDPTVPADTARILNQDPEDIKIGSTGWINMRLASAIAGDARLNLKQAFALARKDAGGPNQQALISALGARALVDWGVMAGIFPATADRNYSPGDYEAASKAFTERQIKINQAYETMAESPTQTSLLVKELVRLFPEMTEDEIRNLRIDYPSAHESRNVGFRQPYNKDVKERLTDVILLNQYAGNPPLGKKESWTNSVFIHPRISIETFRERLKQLPDIKSLVEPKVDAYIKDYKDAQATLLKRVFADLPLKQRMALEASNEIQFFSVRRETGEFLADDNKPNSKVAKSRGTHGLLMRYETGEAKPKYGYYEVFPNSTQVIERTDLPDDLKLGGEITDGIKFTGLGGFYKEKKRTGTELPFDVEAYSSGTDPRCGEKSKVIIEKFGGPLKKRPGHTHQHIPNTYESSRIAQIIDRLQAYSFEGNREARIEHANTKSALLDRNHPTASGATLFTAENARALLKLIPFVGSIADLVEDNVQEGVKGLLIDIGYFLVTGGLAGARHFAKGLRAVLRFNGTPFNGAALKGAATFLRGVLNPLEPFPGLVRAIPNGAKAVPAIGRGQAVHVGANVYLPATAVVQWNWTVGVPDAFSGKSSTSPVQWPGARQGTSHNREVEAVEKNGVWYPIDPITGRPQLTPLPQFTPRTS